MSRLQSNRRGSMLVEMTIAAAMIAAAMVMTVKVLGYAAHQRREAEHRQRALLEASNIMERITAVPYEEVTPEKTQGYIISPVSAALLPGLELNVNIQEQGASPDRPVKRIAVRLRWKGRSGEWEAPVRLTTWIERGRAES